MCFPESDLVSPIKRQLDRRPSAIKDQKILIKFTDQNSNSFLGFLLLPRVFLPQPRLIFSPENSTRKVARHVNLVLLSVYGHPRAPKSSSNYIHIDSSLLPSPSSRFLSCSSFHPPLGPHSCPLNTNYR